MNLFEAKNISKSYGKNRFELKEIAFALNAGEITGVVGENGNGKTTLLRIVAGDLSIDNGELTYFGKTINELGWEKIKQNIAYIPQRIPRWYGSLLHNLIFQASIHGIKGQDADVLVENLIHKLSLEKYIHLNWSEISTGYRLRFQLAKMLIGNPSLLVLDEPIANLDINAQNIFLNDLKKIVSDANYNVSVILSSQQLHEIENIADNILFLKQGKIIYSGAVNAVGKDRKQNEFEIKGEFSVQFLSQLFTTIQIEEIANTYYVTLPKEVNSKEFLQAILAQNKKIEYFRDISSSTRKLFK